MRACYYVVRAYIGVQFFDCQFTVIFRSLWMEVHNIPFRPDLYKSVHKHGLVQVPAEILCQSLVSTGDTILPRPSHLRESG